VQEDKDLVHEFVSHGGLDCLISVGSVIDHNYQNYILRGMRIEALPLAIYNLW